MKSPDLEILLGLVKTLDRELDRYLAGTSDPSDAAAVILETCKKIRAKELTGQVHYLVGAIEQHARQIGNQNKRSGSDTQFLASDAYWGVRLRKDISYLRTELMDARPDSPGH